MISRKDVLEADLLVVGGGIGGLMAAIAAGRAGARVLVLEKAHARRSGSGATGNDHFNCYLPECHGDDMEPVLRETLGSLVGRFKDPGLIRAFLAGSAHIVHMWEDWGINMRPTGEWQCMGHALPGRPRAFLKYDGSEQKAVLLKQAKACGVTVLNRHPVVELALMNGRVAGALALDTGEDAPRLVPVRAKTVLLATGLTHRLYLTAPTPGYMFNTGHCPNCAGGQGLGWRVGARMVNMELPYTHAGPKYLGRCGKATWIGVYRYSDGRPLGPFVTRSNREYGDVTGDIWNTAFSDVMENGDGPVFMDCSDASPDDLAFMRQGMRSEGLTALLNCMDAEGISPAAQAFEFMRYEPVLHGRGLDVDDQGETSVPGLFAVGDMVGNAGCGIGIAAWLGWVAGQAAAKQAATVSFQAAETAPALNAKAELLTAFTTRSGGADWKEANMAIQQIMSDYAPAGPVKVRSETLLRAGIRNMARLRARILDQLSADCSHTLMRCAEVLDLLDCADAILHAARERKESRDAHIRSDYPFTNPLLSDQFLTVGLENGRIATAWRPIRK